MRDDAQTQQLKEQKGCHDLDLELKHYQYYRTINFICIQSKKQSFKQAIERV